MNSFYKAIFGKSSISIIAEIKRRSPSYGPFTQHKENDLVKAYEEGGARAISVVTDKERFDGSIELLEKITATTSLPVLRKDFITETYEIDITKKAGAAAVLLIAHNLTPHTLESLSSYALCMGLTPVIELHNHDDLEKIKNILYSENIIFGINNRNLNTLKTDVYHAFLLLDKMPSHIPVIVESAISSADELKRYQGKVDGALIGTSLLTAQDPKEKLWQFRA